ncbi:MAG: glycosyltransferase family 4 protein, partial [Candidatus Firestonebacteria bacterium]|nr:glycosyltransferase family 4 protein [Candidatus Firestonebacteria bacterium]
TLITKLELGGAQQVALYTAQHLPSAQYEKYLIAGRGGLLDPAARALEHVDVRLWKAFKHPIRPWFDFWTAWRLAVFMRQHKIQIVHTHSSKAGLLGRLAAHWARVPLVVHTVHGWPFHERQHAWVRFLYVALERWAARHTNVLIAVSQATRDAGLKQGIGARAQYAVIYPGSDLGEFHAGTSAQKRAVRQEFGFDTQAPLVGMVACLKPQKAPVDFVKAAGRVHQTNPRVRFLLVGDGPLKARVEAEIAAQGLDRILVLAGWRQDVPRLMRAFDLLAHSSLWEGLPCVFSQALASAVPVVATQVAGAGEIVQVGKNGLLVPPAEPEKLAQALIRVLEKPVLIRKMKKMSQGSTQAFTFPVMQKQIQKLYQKQSEIRLKNH